MRQEDVLSSIQKYVFDYIMETRSKRVPILSHRNPEKIITEAIEKKRNNPYFGVCNIRRQELTPGINLNLDNDTWCVLYVGRDEQDIRWAISDLHQKLVGEKSIIGYLRGYSPPPVLLLDGEGTDLYFYWRGIVEDQSGNEYRTKWSRSVEIIDGDDIQIQVPKIPAGATVFQYYEFAISRMGGDNPRYLITMIDAPQDVLNSPFEHGLERDCRYRVVIPYDNIDMAIRDQISVNDLDQSVPYKAIQIIQCNSDMVENVQEEGLWVGYVTFEANSPEFVVDANPRTVDTIGLNVTIKC